jgi:hypothetical protein
MIETSFLSLKAETLSKSREDVKAKRLSALLAAPAPAKQVGTGAAEVARLLRSVRDERTDSKAFQDAVAQLRRIQVAQRARGAALAEVLA